MSEYNGHPSYEHWNASLWFLNDESLYRLALQCQTAEQLRGELEEMGFNETPDGVALTPELVRYAFDAVHEGDAE